MKLNDVRKLAIRKEMRVIFNMRNGMECQVTEMGISKVPGLDGPPDFNIEEEFSLAPRFRLEILPARGAKGKVDVTNREVSREELESMTSGRSAPVEDQED